MSQGMEQDREMLGCMPKEKLLDLFFLHIKNLWRVDGLYFLGIEERFGTDVATEIDANCWGTMGKIEARDLKEVLGVEKNDLFSFIHLLKNTSWALYQVGKETEATETKAVFKVTDCRTQKTRIHKGLKQFPCKQVRFAYLKSFAEEFNPDIEVSCKTCPPHERPPNVWCEWEFVLR